MKNKILFSAVTFLIISFTNTASAHQPNLVWEMQSTANSPFVIRNPEVSQAFYGKFKNLPEYYKVKIDKLSEFYLSLLIPDNTNAAIGVSARIIKLDSPDSDVKMFLNGNKTEWKEYYEEFAGDFYLQGPEGTKIFRPGEYLIEITAERNEGKYVVVVGKKESFPLNEAMKMILSLPKLKTVFFEEPIYMISSGIVGKLMASLFLFLLLLILMSLRKRKERD